MTLRAALLGAFLSLSCSTAAFSAPAPEVVVSIKPIHSLVASIMKGAGEPALIVEGAASPHTYSLKPSNAQALQQAKLVFWVGHGLEAFLEKPLEALASGATVVELEEAPGLKMLPFRQGGAFEAHDDGDEAAHQHAEEAHDEDAHDHDAHDHGEMDMHLWLDPMNAKAMATAIEKALSAADPANAGLYAANLQALDIRIDALDAELSATVAPVRTRPFVVFHDAYQYFEQRYGVRVAGSITVSPEALPGAKRISEIHQKVAALDATCVFAEPQFEPKLVRVVAEGSNAKSGTLDPEGATVEPGPDLYFTLMRGIATSLRTCLSDAG